MKIGMIDVDSHNFPSLPLMKISSYYKSHGHDIEFYDHDKHYDMVYAAKVFTFSNEPYENVNADIVIKGGSGYDLTTKLPEEIEHTYPDYGLYPDYKDTAYGWLTRGCPRVNHSFCITPKKDGKCVRKVADLNEFANATHKNIVLLDQNLLAASDDVRFNLLDQLGRSKAKIEFNGGLDVRFLDEDIIEKLRNVKVSEHHFAWDDPREDLFSNFQLFAESGLEKPNNVGVYVLVNYWSTIKQDLDRIYALRSLGFVPYVMIYDKGEFVNLKTGIWLDDVAERYSKEQLIHFKTTQHMQRWANTRKLIKTIPKFDDYTNYQSWLEKGSPVPTLNNQLQLVY